ncbi:MAG TPA: hypothetical protein VFZ59_08330 [Verrucomicrobiae bacterium]|nr:hypothetical protein [Verrucomicrobiae bacterium]
MKIKLFIALGMLLSVQFLTATTNDVTGNWQGTLDTGAAKLRLVFKITKRAGGGLSAKMDSIDQGARDIPADPATVSNKTLRMEVKSVQGLYVGTLDATGTKATGLWSQGPVVLPLSLEKGGTKLSEEKLSPEELAANKQAAEKLAGTWNGTLSTGAGELRLRVNLTKTASGGATGTMDSLDQGANGIPISAITLKKDKVRFETRGFGGVYEGTLSTNGAALKGEWQQGGASLPLEFKKASR